ncbi:S-layer homology domain-containing protein [Agathobaculum sp.]|uniref:S-layer homology domain-containing protein n=1 Tax=Agathobaculum sp. TaxID=2048138 RepID=UPI002A81527E|nr:S-layer homology domain-containing protein [Agathobaculum sp.]MDY3619436.1 S-layer homology domain-containing protein [Agathobaculum sp.]
MKKLFALTLCAAMLTGLAPAAFAASETSDDVIQQVVSAIGIMTGDSSGNMNLDHNVTRAEFAKMLVCASSYKDKVSSSSNSSPFKDVPYTNWAAGYVKTAVQQGWLTGYLDGTYRPSNPVTLEEAATGCLKLLGYTTEDFSGSYPYGQLALYESLDLDTKITASKGMNMTRRNMMYLFYNLLSSDTKDGKAYGETLGYSLGADGNIDYLSVLSGTMEGPYVVESTLNAVVSPGGKTVYRNGYASSADAVRKYDVVYYTGSTIWAYANAVTGTYQSASPSAASPSTVKVAGNDYTVGTGEAALALSSLGGLNVGDIVTLLLGRDGEVVYALPAADYAGALAGVVTAVGTATYQNAVGNSYSARTITLTATDGNSYQLPCDKTSISEGDFVSIGFGESGTDVSSLKSNTLSGKVSGDTVGKLTMAKDIRILDVRDTLAGRVYASRLDGATLDSSDVRWYQTNAAGEITDLILKDFTGDLYEYGLITSAKEESSGMSLSGSYTYLLAGEKKTISTNGKTLGASYGPARLTIENGQLSAVRALEQIKTPDAVTLLGVTKDDESWLFADDCAVYLYANSNYSLLSLTELRNNFDSYNITCYYDNETRDGGRIRIVVARAKG